MERAKELFFQSSGIKHFMWHDGTKDEYDSYCISKEQEALWYEELQQQLIKRLISGEDPYMIVSQLETIGNEIDDYRNFDKAIEILKSKPKTLL